MRQSTKKRLRVAAVALVCLVVISVAAFFAYASDYYRADAVAVETLQSDTGIRTSGAYTVFMPSEPADTALIFYPGAKVEAIAYAPILEKLKQQGIACVLVEMPFNMAIFDQNAADGAYGLLPDVDNWYVGGHSMGGAMASSYASNNGDKVRGLILLGAYVYGDYPPSKALTVYGSFNSNLEDNIDYTDNIVKIEGGNHAQFGNYGSQKGDPPATISRDEQQNRAVEAIVDFVDN